MRKPRLAYRYVRPTCYGQVHGCFDREYTIPVRYKDGRLLSLEAIRFYVQGFIDYAKNHPRYFFLVHPMACHPGEYSPEEIAPLFSGCPDNVFLPGTWEPDHATLLTKA